MAEFPALPFFTDAYLADTRHLTSEEHGAYLLLLFCAWRTRGCALKDCDKTLARIAGLTPTKWRRLRPTISDFFEISGGFWRQKKLSAVYADVTERVARNKANGAKGGKARAVESTAQRTTKQTSPQPPKQNPQPTPQPTLCDTQAAKTKTKSGQQASPIELKENQNAFEQAPEAWRAAVSAVCGPEIQLDDGVLFQWAAADADVETDIVPTLKTLKYREISRTGRPPKTLGYFRAAVLEATANRLLQAGRVAAQTSNQATKKPFDPVSEADWRAVLGDENSAFRADYMAKNWFIPRDHPVFQAAELGPNPRLSKTSHLPAAIRKAYGRKWRWLAPG